MSRATTQATTAPVADVKPDRAEIRRALDALTVAGQTFEIRAILKGGGAKSQSATVWRMGSPRPRNSGPPREIYFHAQSLASGSCRRREGCRRHPAPFLLVDVDAVRAESGEQNATEAERQGSHRPGVRDPRFPDWSRVAAGRS